MYAEKRDSMMKKTIKTLCYSYGWCYGIFWGFDQRNSLLLTVKDAYCEEQMGALIDTMLLQTHVLGGGVIGQAAFMKNHRWMHSDDLHQRQNSLGSFDNLEVFQDDSELFYQFSMGIKTIAVISVEPWGVMQLGSFLKNPETKGFVDQVKELFGEIDNHEEINVFGNEPHSDSQVFDSSIQLNSVLSSCISHSVDQDLKSGPYSEDFAEAIHSLVLPSQSFPCSTSDYQSRNLIFPASSPIQIESGDFFDCSPLTSWPQLTSGLEEIMPLNLEEVFDGSNFAVSKRGLEDDFSQWFSPQPNSNPLPAYGLIQKSSLSGNNTPVYKSQNLPTKSLQSSVTDALTSSLNVKDSEWLSEKNVGSTSNSLFSKLGLDRLLDGIACTSHCPLDQSRFDGQSSSQSKRRKTDDFSGTHKFESLPSFGRKMQSLNMAYGTEAKKIEVNSLDSTKEPHSCAGDSCIIDAGKTSSSRGQEEQAKTKKKKAKPGTRPRPKDRQMIQDRLAELRELVPNGDKMSIDRLLERTIRHLTFMQSLTKHAESLKQIDMEKSREVQENQSINGGGGVTWACEVGDQAMVCPLIVEDLGTQGQMLIEMLCEEQGFFLEIVDVIRGFGLIIRKGVMEVRGTNKIWAHFLVEAEGNRCVSRHEIFSSLINLLQMSGQSAANASVSMPAFNNFPASTSLPLNFPDALQCANL